MLSEIDQVEKDKYHMISLICGIQKQNKPIKKKWESGSRAMNLEAPAVISEVADGGRVGAVEMQEGSGLGYILEVEPNRLANEQRE